MVYHRLARQRSSLDELALALIPWLAGVLEHLTTIENEGYPAVDNPAWGKGVAQVRYQAVKNGVVPQIIVRAEKIEPLSPRSPDCLVERIVRAFVWSGLPVCDAMGVRLEDFDGAVGRTAVLDDQLPSGVSLACNAVQATLERT